MSSAPRPGAKRKGDKRKYFNVKRRKGKRLEPGITGFLVTCNRNEQRCLFESYDLLNHYADKLGLAKDRGQSASNDKEDDFEAAFSKEVEGLKSGKLFQQVDTNAKNILFITSTLELDPNLVVDAIIGDVKSGVRAGAKHMMRILPVIGTCKADLEKLTQLAETILAPTFSPASPEPRRYHVEFKARNNDALERYSTVKEVSSVIQSLGPDNVVDYDDPDVTVLIDVVCTVVCVAVVKRYKDNKKYNLQELVKDRANGLRGEGEGGKEEEEKEGKETGGNEETRVNKKEETGETKVKEENGNVEVRKEDAGVKKETLLMEKRTESRDNPSDVVPNEHTSSSIVDKSNLVKSDSPPSVAGSDEAVSLGS